MISAFKTCAVCTDVKLPYNSQSHMWNEIKSLLMAMDVHLISAHCNDKFCSQIVTTLRTEYYLLNIISASGTCGYCN